MRGPLCTGIHIRECHKVTMRLKGYHPELDFTVKRLGWMRVLLLVALCGVQLWHMYILVQLISADTGLLFRPVNPRTTALGLIVLWFAALFAGVVKKSVLSMLAFALASSLMALVSWIPEDSGMAVVFLSLIFISIHRNMLFATLCSAVTALVAFILWWLMGRTFPFLFVGIVFTSLLLFSWLFHDFLLSWNESLTLFSQARWAASEYTKVNIRLQDSMTTTEMNVRDQERMRIAREIHDILGYGITGSLVQITVAKELVRMDANAAVETLGRIEDSLRTALKDVRGEVNKLKDRSAVLGDWRERWIGLCNNFAWSTGVQVRTNISTDLESVDEEIGENIYRIIQEALTNAYRHGSSSLIDVSMKYKTETHQILLRISDNGYGCDKIRIGNGLNGIRERVKDLSGETAWQTERNAGFDLGVGIPWTKGASIAED